MPPRGCCCPWLARGHRARSLAPTPVPSLAGRGELADGKDLMTNAFDLSGKVALVTGANAGIGRAIAVALAGAGADVALAGRTAAGETKTEVEALGRRGLIVEADLATIEPCKRAVEETVAGLG